VNGDRLESVQCSETSVFNIQTPGKYPEYNLSAVVLVVPIVVLVVLAVESN
jgi:hypothetical protein